MQLNGVTGADWEVINNKGEGDVVEDVHSAYVDKDTGTLHFVDKERYTIAAFARGAWAQVQPR